MVKGLLVRLLANMVALYLTVLIVHAARLDLQFHPTRGHGPMAAVVSLALTVIVLGLVNALLGPIIRLFTLPISCLTLGLFGLIINALLFWLVGHLGLGLHVGGFWPALAGSLLMGLLSALISHVGSAV